MDCARLYVFVHSGAGWLQIATNWFPFNVGGIYSRGSESLDAIPHLRFRSRGRHAMKRFLTAGPTFFGAALALTLLFGCGDIDGETGSQSAELNAGQCNAIVATSLSSAQRCARGECGFDECTDVGGALLDFFANNPECGALFDAGDANGLPGNASIHPQTDALKHIGDVICGSVVQCGLCPVAPPGACTGPCEEAAL